MGWKQVKYYLTITIQSQSWLARMGITTRELAKRYSKFTCYLNNQLYLLVVCAVAKLKMIIQKNLECMKKPCSFVMRSILYQLGLYQDERLK